MGGLIGPGNVIALLALVGWPVVVVVMFNKLSPERALIWSILGAYMFLPEVSAFELPLIPRLDKNSIPALTAFGTFIALYGRFPSLIPQSILGKGIIFALVTSPVFTVLTNLEPVIFGQDSFGGLTVFNGGGLAIAGLPGLRIYDTASALAGRVFTLLPFFLAREILNTEKAIRELLYALVIGAALYAIPMMWEARMSPQLHTQIYGFFQHDFAQAIRQGGFRPFVFMPHGLWVGFFVFMCTMAAAVRYRMASPKSRPLALFALIACFVLVIFSKSWGPLLFTVVFLPVVLFFSPRFQLRIAMILVALVLSFPILRGTGAIPTEAIISNLEEVSGERAQSLGYRFNNEDNVLNHTMVKPLFGWGGWGRFFVYDDTTGETNTVVDGMWVLTIGQYGWFGFLAMFGLLCLPIYLVWRSSGGKNAREIPLPVSVLTLILAVNLVDLLPNATLVSLTWLIAGALVGYAENPVRVSEQQRAARPVLRRTVLNSEVLARETSARRPDSSGERTVL